MIVMSTNAKMGLWKFIGVVSVLWIVVGYCIGMSLEEGSIPTKVTLTSLLIPIILIPLSIHYYKDAKAESLNMSLDDYNKIKNDEVEKWRQDFQDSKKPKLDENGKVMCPKCGSSNIQVLNKKWSATTGFMTNKVDRVCINCKNRF
jgi:DNA-directed RNA polymerase subunit M/transcription elongation factor TFIIS